MVKSIKKPLSSRTKFIRELAELEIREPFTRTEREKLTFQERNFIRGIQVTKGITKRDGIAEFKKIKGKKEKIRKQGKDIQERYRGVKSFKSRIPVSGVCRPIKEDKTGTGYIYKGVTKKADKVLIERFVRDKKSPPSARRYIDRLSGESISRRERDRRISRVVNK